MNDTRSHRREIYLLLASCMLSSVAVADAKKASLDSVVLRAFEAAHNGWSSDEVLLQDKLNKQFISLCHRAAPNASVADLNWTLLNLRKAGKLKVDVTRSRRDDHEPYRHLAEIAARSVQDKHKVTTDRMMCDETMREEFDEQARLLAKDTSPYLMRKAAFGLRKSRRLKPELILRIADWDRDISVYMASKIANDPSVVPQSPGIYIFRDVTGYLYVGESKDLRDRLSKHLDQSDRESLANYLQKTGKDEISIEIHAFPKDSRAKQTSIRRAYESALIASRNPRFNLRP